MRVLIVAQQARIAELEAKLAQNSSNSSRPPSTDPPGAPRPTKPSSGLPRGGQKGHKGHRRELLPPERIDAVHDCKPRECRRCAAALIGEDPSPLRHQVVDIPKVLARAVEYRLHRLRCACGATTCADLPAGVPLGNFGPRLVALVATLASGYRLPQRPIRQLLSDVFGVDLSTGMIPKLEQQCAAAVAPAVEEAARHVQAQPVVHADETGWREAKRKAWLWVALAVNVCVFLVAKSRGAGVARRLLGDHFGGTLVSDRWCAYAFVDDTQRQLCWAHLKRHFIGFEDHGPDGKRIGKALQRQCKRMFRLWHQVRDGTLARADFITAMAPVERRILALLDQGRACASRKVAGQCREILDHEPALFTFVRTDGVEPTNNAAERAIRHAVIWRKGSYGTDSERGSRFVERMLTVVTTLRMQGRNVLEWVTEAAAASVKHAPSPSLLITPQTDDQALAIAA